MFGVMAGTKGRATRREKVGDAVKKKFFLAFLIEKVY